MERGISMPRTSAEGKKKLCREHQQKAKGNYSGIEIPLSRTNESWAES